MGKFQPHSNVDKTLGKLYPKPNTKKHKRGEKDKEKREIESEREREGPYRKKTWREDSPDAEFPEGYPSKPTSKSVFPHNNRRIIFIFNFNKWKVIHNKNIE